MAQLHLPHWLISILINGWLVVAVVLFLAIIAVTFRPSARAQMDRNARIPFDVEDEADGRP